MEWEFPVLETREATGSAAIRAGTLMNRDLRFQHAMARVPLMDQRRKFVRPALHDRGTRRRSFSETFAALHSAG